METSEIITILIFPAIAGLYWQTYKLHGCLKRLEGTVNGLHKN